MNASQKTLLSWSVPYWVNHSKRFVRCRLRSFLPPRIMAWTKIAAVTCAVASALCLAAFGHDLVRPIVIAITVVFAQWIAVCLYVILFWWLSHWIAWACPPWVRITRDRIEISPIDASKAVIDLKEVQVVEIEHLAKAKRQLVIRSHDAVCRVPIPDSVDIAVQKSLMPLATFKEGAIGGEERSCHF